MILLSAIKSKSGVLVCHCKKLTKFITNNMIEGWLGRELLGFPELRYSQEN